MKKTAKKITIEEQLGVFTHQLKHRISKIKEYLSLITEGEFGVVNQRIKQPLKNSIAYLRDINALIEETGELLNNRVRGTPLYKEHIDIASLIKKELKELETDAHAKHIALRFVNEAPRVKLRINKELMRALIANILENAIIYSSLGTVLVRLKKQAKKAIIEVRDSGIGFKKSQAPTLFKRFNRNNISRSLHPHGLGLGLYIAHLIMKAHNGTIKASSAGPGKGATFSITLPL